MFVMEPSNDLQSSWWQRNKWTVLVLALIVLLAGTLRVAFNYESATEPEYRYAGNDDYYHLRVVEEVQRTGNHVVSDPLLNYPIPAKNPRPPVYDWHVAIFGQILGFVSGEASPGQSALNSGGYALEWGSAFWGALTVVPIFLIGRTTFGNKAGLWAAFLLAASPAHIQRSGFGLGDHDGFIVFFLCLGAYFLVRALQLTRDDVKVGRWTDLGSVGGGFSAYVGAHAEGLAFAFLAGVSWATIALTWEGFPYVLAIYAVYYVFQLFSNQLRRRDSTGDFLVFALIVGTTLVMALPYYWITGNVHTTLNSYVYVVLVMMVLSLALIPTRDLPAILVLPALAAVSILGLLILLFVLPDVGSLLFSANGYFNQSKLYSTIAEAQRTDLGVFVFSIGFMTFFFALIGFVMATVRYFRLKERAMLFLVGWGLLSIYMGFAATRFVFNAAPIFAVLAGMVTQRIVGWMNFKERFKNFQSLKQDSFFRATRSTMGAKQIAGSLFILMFLIVPNLWFSVDAGLPSEARFNYRQNHPGARDIINNRTGAFGQGFLDHHWLEVYGWLEQQDTGMPDAMKPAHVAWWDYGFWEVAIARHPTVADNFQNGFGIAGRFLAAQSEKEGLLWLSVRLLEGDWVRNSRDFSAPVSSYLSATNASLPGALASKEFLYPIETAYRALNATMPDLESSRAFYDGLQGVTGFRIEYFLVDDRMLPLDNPNTPYIDSGSILYAPLYLANKNPDDFVQTVYVDTTSREYEVKAYVTGADNVSRQVSPPRVEDDEGNCYFVSGQQIFRGRADCRQIDFGFNGGQGVQLQGTKLVFKDAFYSTMFYKGFIGGEKPEFAASYAYPNDAFQGNGTAGKGLKHWRLVFTDDDLRVKLLQYYPGAIVSGRATLQGGQPLAGMRAVALDPFGIEHDSAPIGSDGGYRLIMPFSLPGEAPVQIAIMSGSDLVTSVRLNVSKAQAFRQADYNLTQDVRVAPGALSGNIYFDRDRDGAYNASIDQPLEGATVTVDGRSTTSGSGGAYSFSDVLPGAKTVTASKAGYTGSSGSGMMAQGGTAGVDVLVTATSVTVSGTLVKPGGSEPLAGAPLNLTAERPETDFTANATATSDSQGNFTASLNPGGKYRVSLDFTTQENNRTVRYRGATTIDVPVGSPAIVVTSNQLGITRTES